MEEERYYYEEDEIDLYELWLVVKKRWKIILGLFLCATILTTIASFLITPVYKSHFLVKTPVVTTNEAKSLIDIINTFLKERKYKQLKNLLNLEENILQNLKKISCKLTRGEKQSLTLEIETTHKEDIPRISDALIDYLNRNQYVTERIQAEKENLEKQKELLLSKLNEMKTLRKTTLKKIEDGKGNIIIFGFNPMEIERSIIRTKIQLLDTEKNLKLLKGFEKITQPFIPERPFKPKKKLMVAVSGITALFFGVFLIFFLEWLDKARQEHIRRR